MAVFLFFKYILTQSIFDGRMDILESGRNNAYYFICSRFNITYDIGFLPRNKCSDKSGGSAKFAVLINQHPFVSALYLRFLVLFQEEV